MQLVLSSLWDYIPVISLRGEMQSSGPGWNLPTTAGSVGGCLFALGVSAGVIWLKKRKREQRHERPPQEEKILRPPGYFGICRLAELEEDLVDVIFRAMAAGLLLGATLGGLWPVAAGLVSRDFTMEQFWATPRSSVATGALVSGLLTLLWAIREFRKIWQLVDDIRNCRFGLRGEQAVAEKLMDRDLTAAGYTAFHDLPAEKGGKKWNVDHVVVGPGGVFVLETKARPRRRARGTQREHEVRFDGEVLHFPWCYDAKAAKQARYNVDWVRKYLGVYAPQNLRIQPVIVVPGWFVAPTEKEFDVKVMNAKYLVAYLRNAPKLFKPEELAMVIQRVDDRCRSLEF